MLLLSPLGFQNCVNLVLTCYYVMLFLLQDIQRFYNTVIEELPSNVADLI
jgi:hypothetical protein